MNSCMQSCGLSRVFAVLRDPFFSSAVAEIRLVGKVLLIEVVDEISSPNRAQINF